MRRLPYKLTPLCLLVLLSICSLTSCAPRAPETRIEYREIERPIQPGLFQHRDEPGEPAMGATKGAWRVFTRDLAAWGRSMAAQLDCAKVVLVDKLVCNAPTGAR